MIGARKRIRGLSAQEAKPKTIAGTRLDSLEQRQGGGKGEREACTKRCARARGSYKAVSPPRLCSKKPGEERGIGIGDQGGWGTQGADTAGVGEGGSPQTGNTMGVKRGVRELDYLVQ